MIIEGLFGAYDAQQAREQARRGRDDLLSGSQQAIDAYQQGIGEAQQYFDPYRQGGLQAWEQLQGLQDPIQDPSQYIVEPERFEYSGNVEQFLDPSMGYEMEQARGNIEASMAGQGALQSGATLKALQDRSQQIARQGYADAFSRMNQDKEFKYRDFAQDFANRRNNALQRYEMAVGQYNRQQGNLQNIANAGLQVNQNLAGLATNQGEFLANQYMDQANANAMVSQSPTMGEGFGQGFKRGTQEGMGMLTGALSGGTL